MRHFIAWSGCLIVSLLAVGMAPAVEPDSGARVDRFGDALPRGAISRLGARKVGLPGGEPAITTKFLCDDFATFSPNGKLFTSGRQLWDVATGRVILELKLDGRLLFASNGEPYIVTFDKDRLAARPMKPVPPGWEVATKSPAVSLSTGHVVFAIRPGDDDPLREFSTNLRNVFTGFDEHRLEGELVAGAGKSPEPWRFGVSRDGKQFSIVTRTSHVELHTRGEAGQRTKGVDGLPGLSTTEPSVTLMSPDGRHLAVVPGNLGQRIQVVASQGLVPISALRDATPPAYGGGRFGAAFMGDATQLAVLRGGDDGKALAILRVWNAATEGMIANKRLRSANDLRDAALWLAARGLRGEVPSGFVPLDSLPHMSPALQCQLSSRLLESTAAISRSGELVALAEDLCISIWETATHKCVQRMQPGENVVRLVFSPDDRLLLAHYERGTALVFEAVQPAEELQTRSAKDLWNDLAGGNSRAARKAMLELARRGDEGLSLLDEAFPRGRSPEEIRRWIADLNAADKADRDAAQARLYALGPVGLPYLQAAVRGNPSDEQIVRIRAILEHPAETVVDAEVLRGVRAIQVAALIGSEPAVDRLKRIGEGKSDPRIVSRAGESYRRLRPAQVGLMP